MTDSYNQQDINLRDASPITVNTPDATPVSFLIDTLTADGQSLAVDLYGGGSDPLLPTTNNYVVVTGVAIFTREAGAGTVQPGAIATIPVGAFPVTLTFTVNDLGPPDNLTQCFLTITPFAASPAYNHQLKISKIRF